MKPAQTPGIAHTLWIIGAICIAIGGIGFFAMMADGRPAATDIVGALSGVVFGLLFVAGGSVVDRLSRIEHHLNPENQNAPVAPREADKPNVLGY